MKKFALAAFLVVSSGSPMRRIPTGTWTWKTKFGKDGKEAEQTLKLKLEGDKVTGTLSGGRGGKGDTKIEDGKFKNDEVSFTVTREFKDMKFVTKYAGKVTDDAITGTITDRDATARKTNEIGKPSEPERRRTEPGGSGRINAPSTRRVPPGRRFCISSVDGCRPIGHDELAIRVLRGCHVLPPAMPRSPLGRPRSPARVHARSNCWSSSPSSRF